MTHFQRGSVCSQDQNGFTTSEVIVSIALLSAFYAAILTVSSIVYSSSRPSEIRPALDQVITSDIEFIRNNAWGYQYHSQGNTQCYLTDPKCPPNKNKSIDYMRSKCSNINSKFLKSIRLPTITLSALSHSVFRDNTALKLNRSITYNTTLPIPLRVYEKNSIRLDYYLHSSDPALFDQLSDVSSIVNNRLLLRTYTFTPSAQSFCTGFSVF